jgi:hypothetical protein
MLYGLFFLLGVLVQKLGSILLDIEPMFKYWKLAEFNSLKVLAESELLYRQSITILEISYNDAGKTEEFPKIKDAINKKHREIQMSLLNQMRLILPYETNYKTPEEAFKIIEKIAKQEIDNE